MAENENEETKQDLSDMDVAELANKEIRARDAEIAELKKKLAVSKLYSEADEEVDEPMSVEECVQVILSPNSSNYDYAQAVIDYCKQAEDERKPNPLGENGEQVLQFFQSVIDACEGDKSQFTHLYYAMLGSDAPEVAAAYKKRNVR